MSNALIIFLAAFLILRLFCKVDRTKAFCGIFAFSGVKDIDINQIKLAINKIKILGLYNESRGGDGAGVFFNNTIVKCGDKQTRWQNLIEDHIIDDSQENHVMLGHCRKKSRGVVSQENSHPFLINDNLVGIHNGTIENIEELCKKYGVDSAGIFNDSKLLYMIIEKEGTDVLEHYRGYAAMIWTNKDEPNTIQIFKGASKNYSTGPVVEERPLFFMKTKEGIYLSSIEESLFAIRDDLNQVPECLTPNVVFRIKNGKITQYRKIVEREDSNLYKYNNNFPNYKGQGGYPNYDAYDDCMDYGGGCMGQGPRTRTFPKTTQNKQHFDKVEPMVWRETLPFKFAGAVEPFPVYFHKGRYFHNPKELCHGELFLLPRGVIAANSNMSVAKPYYFYNGVMLRNKYTWERLLRDIETSKVYLDNPHANAAMYLSNYAEYPVTNLPNESKEVNKADRFKWWMDGRARLEGFTPKFSGRNYKIKNGYLYDINGSNSQDKMTLFTTYEIGTYPEKESREVGSIQVPFLTDDDIAPNTEFNDPVFDAVYPSIAIASSEITDLYLMALKFFIQEKIKNESNLDADSEEIDNAVLMSIQYAVQRKISIRASVEDTNGALDSYLESLAGLSPHGSLLPVKIDPKSQQLELSNSILDEMIAASEQVEEEFIEAEEDKASDDLENANETVEEMVGILEQLNEKNAELSMNESEFAKECTDLMTRTLDTLKHGLAEKAEQYSNVDLTRKINNSIL